MRIRPMTATDRNQVGDLLNDIFRWQHGVRDQDIFSDFPLVFVESNYRNCRVIEDESTGKIVSHAAIFPCDTVVGQQRYRTAIIVLVATAESHRHRGYAAAIMRDLQRTMLEEDYDLGVLWTGVPQFYEQLGWETVVPPGWLIDDLRAAMWPRCESSDDWTVERYDAALHLDDIGRLHDQEPVRIVRNRHEYAALLQLPKVQTWVTRRVNDDQLAGYACLAEARNKQGIIEYGGSAEAILRLVQGLAEPSKCDLPLRMIVYPTQQEVAAVVSSTFEGQPLSSSKGGGTEMIYVVPGVTFPAAHRAQHFVWGLDTT